jgi:glyoxylase-like metal-dependent hydrolase (beta-lactamase superfamily II)
VVAPGVRRFTVPLPFPSPDHVHVHVLETAEGELLVDTGACGSEARLHEGLTALEAHPDRVLITHGHVDHWGLAVTLADEVLAHPGVLPSLQWGEPDTPETSYGPGAPTHTEMVRVFAAFGALSAGVPVVRAIADGDRLGDWEVMATPGHDAGHVCLFRARDGVLLCGDLLLPGFTPNIQPNVDGSDALADFYGSLERMAQLDVRLVLPAHGEAYTDHRLRTRELRAHHDKRLDELRTELTDGPRSLEGLRGAVFGGHLPSAPYRLLANLETYAHLDHLRRRGEVALAGDGRWTRAAAA